MTPETLSTIGWSITQQKSWHDWALVWSSSNRKMENVQFTYFGHHAKILHKFSFRQMSYDAQKTLPVQPFQPGLRWESEGSSTFHLGKKRQNKSFLFWLLAALGLTLLWCGLLFMFKLFRLLYFSFLDLFYWYFCVMVIFCSKNFIFSNVQIFFKNFQIFQKVPTPAQKKQRALNSNNS